MLFDLYDIPFEAQAVYLLFGGVLGVLFGALALLTRFCLRQAVTGESAQGMAAKSVWATAFIAAILGNLALEYAGFIELSEHRLFAHKRASTRRAKATDVCPTHQPQRPNPSHDHGRLTRD
mgnify:CR=1 FL=1